MVSSERHDGPRRLRRGLHTTEFGTVDYLSGPLIFIGNATGVHSAEVVDIVAPDGGIRRGQVLEIDQDRAVIEVYSGTRGLDVATTRVRLGGDAARTPVGESLLGRMLDGAGRPIDGGPPVMAEAYWDINGLPINPAARRFPTEYMETGISAIDGLNTLLRGQKLPIFSGFGLPAGGMVGVVEGVAGGRVDRHRAGVRGRVGFLAGVQRQSSWAKVLAHQFDSWGRDFVERAGQFRPNRGD